MELELENETLHTYECCREMIWTQEETAENIVPDYCPDIARIVETSGKLFLHSRELREGKAELSGTVRVTVLYLPEGEGGMRSLEFAMPFTATGEQELTGCSRMTAQAECEFLETRMLNPRKLFTHCKLVLHITPYRKSVLELCRDVQAEECLHIQKLQVPQRVIQLTQLAEKDFTFTETMDLSNGRNGAQELLRSQIRTAVTDLKIVGSKLICKGAFRIDLLYRNTEGGCAASCQELPFSQILELESEAEQAVPSVQLQLTGSDVQIDGDDPEGRQVSVTLYLHATALLREEREVLLLQDLYSTAHPLTYEAVNCELVDDRQVRLCRQNVREVLEVGVPAETVLCATVSCGGAAVSRDGREAVLRTTVLLRILYLDAGNVPLMAERSLEVTCRTEAEDGCKAAVEACCREEVQASAGERGIEVRFPVEFRVELISQAQRSCIRSVKVERDRQKISGPAPSLVLRCLGQKESTWELAKSCNTTIGEILAANGLESEAAIEPEKLLLIPRLRG